MKNLLVCIVLLLIGLEVESQIVLMDPVADEDSVIERYGPNRRHYMFGYFGFGFVVGPTVGGSGTDMIYGRSIQLLFGGPQYKRKFNEVLSAGGGTYFEYKSYHFKQIAGKTFPDATLHNMAKYRTFGLGIEAFVRANYGKRGNQIGNYVDFSMYGMWTFQRRYVTKDKYPVPQSAGNFADRVINRKLDWANPTNYGFRVRLGFNWFSVYYDYRFSSLVKTDQFPTFPDMPRSVIGIQITSHKE